MSVRGAALLFVFTLVIANPAIAVCVFPSVLRADVGVTVSTTGGNVRAPGSATLVDYAGETCWTYNVTATLTITQDTPALIYSQSGTRLGEYVSTLAAPAQAGSCYTSTINAQGKLIDSGLVTRIVNAGPACWVGPPDRCDRFPERCDNWRENCPIVVNTGTDPWQFTGVDNTVWFDMDGDGDKERTTWTKRDSSLAFVVRDLNGNGRVDGAGEFLGDSTLRRDGTRAAHGFEVLQELDDDGDGRVSATDAAWASLLLWTDRNHNGISDPHEIVPISGSDIRALATKYHYTGRIDPNGNSLRYRSLLLEPHGTKPYYDVFLLNER